MTAASVANSNNRLTDADATTGWSSDSGTGAGPQNEPDLGYQLTSGVNYSVSRKVGATKGGQIYVHTGETDMTAEANQVCMYKCVWYNSINSAAYPACGVKIGNSSSIFYEYAVIDDGTQGDLDADPKRLVYIIAVDPNEGAWPDIISGTPPTLTTLDAFGIQGDFGGSAKAENVAMDAVDLVRGNGVLWLTGGTGADPRGTYDDFVTHDEGTIANRFGHISTVRAGVFEVFGKLWVGRSETPTATASGFEDANKTLLFGPGFFGAGWTGIGYDLGADGDDVLLKDMTFQGQGQSGKKVYFDTITQIDPTPDEVTLVPAPGFVSGVPVIYNNDGGSDTIGLTSGNQYWLERVTDTTFNVHASRNDARTGATPIALSDGSTGESHWFQRGPDTRPDCDIVGNTDNWTATRCKFSAFRNILATTTSTWTSCVFGGTELIDLTTNNGGTITDSTVSGQTTEPGVGFIQTNTMANVTGCAFELAGTETGHSFEVDATGTMAMTGNLFDGYWVSPDNEAGAEFVTDTGVDDVGNDITTTGLHGFSTGEEVWYNDNVLSDTIGLTDGNRYYVNVISTTNISFHRSKENATADSNRVSLNNTGTGQTHTLYSGNAAGLNSSGGLVTLNVGGGGDQPSMRNVGAATTTIAATVTITVTPVFIGSEVRAFLAGTTTEVGGGVENSAGTSVALSLASGTSHDIVVLSVPTTARPNDTPAVPVRLESVSFAGNQDLDPFQQFNRNFANPD